MMPKTFILGTRGSQLALRQSEMVRDALLQHFPDLHIELKIIKTKGDQLQHLALDASGDKGLFTGALEEALRNGVIDFAVHSLKDLPVDPAPGTRIAAYLPRAVTHDTLIGSVPLDALPEGALIGTSSKRRAYQIALHYPHLRTAPIRGNVETRMKKVEEGLFDATLLAEAGLTRLSMTEVTRFPISEDVIVPAPGQAAIAVQTRDEASNLQELLSHIHDAKTEQEVTIERSLLKRLGGGCALPLGCCCHITEGMAELRIFYANSTGTDHYLATHHAPLSQIDTLLAQLTERLKHITTL